MKPLSIFRFLLRIITFGKYPPLSVEEAYDKMKKEHDRWLSLPEDERERISSEAEGRFIQGMKERNPGLRRMKRL